MLQQGINIVFAGLLLFFVGRWAWIHRPHHESHQGLVLHRLSDIIVALNAIKQQAAMPDAEAGVQSGFLLEIRNALNDMRVAVEENTKAQKEAAGPTLDALREFQRAHVDVSSRTHAQMSEVISLLRNPPNDSAPERIAGMLADVATNDRIDVLIAACESLVRLEGSKPKDHERHMLAALDTLAVEFEKFRKQQAAFLNSIFNGGSVSTVDDADAAEMEEIETLMRRYGIDRPTATDRVRARKTYSANAGRGGMGANA